SATRTGSSSSRANGLAVVTAQKPQARVQRSPAIMNVAVPLLQHSQWFGHFALSQTVCSFSSSSRSRVRAKVSEVGNLMRNHSGRRGRGFNGFSAVAIVSIRVHSRFQYIITTCLVANSSKTPQVLSLRNQPESG